MGINMKNKNRPFQKKQNDNENAGKLMPKVYDEEKHQQYVKDITKAKNVIHLLKFTLVLPIVGWCICYRYIFKSKLNTVTQFHDDYILPFAFVGAPILFGHIFAPFLASAPSTDFINLCKNIFVFILTYLHSFIMLVYINRRFKK